MLFQLVASFGGLRVGNECFLQMLVNRPSIKKARWAIFVFAATFFVEIFVTLQSDTNALERPFMNTVHAQTVLSFSLL